MHTLEMNEKLSSLIHELDFNNAEEIIKSSLRTEILCRISGFSEEVEHFEKKYGKKFNDFQKENEAGEEDFQKFDDLMEWKFAQQGKEYWKKKLEELKSVL